MNCALPFYVKTDSNALVNVNNTNLLASYEAKHFSSSIYRAVVCNRPGSACPADRTPITRDQVSMPAGRWDSFQPEPSVALIVYC